MFSNICAYSLSCCKVACNPTHNIFAYNYRPVTDESNKTRTKLLVLSDMIRYADTFRILKHLYGDDTYRHNLEPDFAKKYPTVINKYFSNVDDVPDYIRNELGL